MALPDLSLARARVAPQGEPRRRRQRFRAGGRLVAREIWAYLAVLPLNFEYAGGGDPRLWEHPPVLHLAQRTAYQTIIAHVGGFLGGPLVRQPSVDWSTKVSKLRVDYTGEEQSVAPPTRLAELIPGLSYKQYAAQLQTEEFVDEHILERLLDPEAVTLPPAEWPDAPPRARVNCEKLEDWCEVAEHLLGLGTLGVVREADIFAPHGQEVFTGLFAREKKGKPLKGQVRCIRLIVNMISSNPYFRNIVGDTATLAASTTWISTNLQAGCVIVWSSDDQKGAFYVWKLPPAWRGRMAVSVPVPASAAGLPGDQIVYVAFRVYIDDFDAPEVMQAAEAYRVVGAPGEMQLAMQQACARAEVAYTGDKSHARQLQLERMGASLDGSVGTARAPTDKTIELVRCILYALGRDYCPRLLMLTLRGRAVLIVSLFDGVAALAVAMSRLPVDVIGMVCSEIDKPARRVVRLRWPGAADWGEIRSIAEADVVKLADTYYSLCDACACGAGSPCHASSGANRAMAGPARPLSESFYGFTDRKEMIEVLGVTPTQLCSSVFVPARRPRYYWCSWPLEMRGEIAVGEACQGHQCCLAARHTHGTTVPLDWVTAGWTWGGGDGPAPTLGPYTRVAHKDPEALGISDARDFLLGNSYSVYSVTWLLQQLFLARGLLARELPAEALCHGGACPLSWGEVGSYAKGAAECGKKLAPQLTGEILALSVRSGSDIRLDVGLPHRPRAWPRASISPLNWHWRVGASLRWQDKGDPHINACQLQTGVAALLWRSRSSKHLNVRFVHLFDSQVVAAIATKGRSSSVRLQLLLRKWSVLCETGGRYLVAGYITTEDNPADAPSRRQWKARGKGKPSLTPQKVRRHSFKGLLRVTATTLGRYRAAITRVPDHWDAIGLWPSGPLDIDEGIAEYIEMLRSEDQPVSMANYQSLGLSWSLLKARRRCEPQVRALPFTPELILGMAAVAIKCGAKDVGALLALGFAGLLRTTELFIICKQQVAIISGKVTVRLPETKTGYRKAMTEMVVVDCPVAVGLVRRQWHDHAMPSDTISRRTPSQLRACLKKLLSFFRLDGFRLSWYSCRRGGATYDFMSHQSMETTIMRGRWGSATTAKLYIEQAVADIVQVTPAQEDDELIRHFACQLYRSICQYRA
ncbi:unnamed protein product [Prorocentrum cordatum]|uniref:Uncharacterized protein n=1 Tax=Prorocentrum cordatum TaxID=2364126 RepID=A0ABN9RLB1_9DINO|nr:unnamed protein product [Polarella glacialis]